MAKFQRKLARRKHPSISAHQRYIGTNVQIPEFDELPNRAAKREWIRGQIAKR